MSSVERPRTHDARSNPQIEHPSRDELEPDDLIRLVHAVAASTDWEPLVRYSSTGRWWTRLGRDQRADVWLLTWLTGHATDLHDHGESAGAFVVLSGALDEIRANAAGRLRRSTIVGGVGGVGTNYVKNNTSYIPRGTVHDVRNPHATAAISIHAYSPPLSSMTFYRPTTAGLQAVATVPTNEPEAAVPA